MLCLSLSRREITCCCILQTRNHLLLHIEPRGKCRLSESGEFAALADDIVGGVGHGALFFFLPFPAGVSFSILPLRTAKIEFESLACRW